MSIRRSTPYEPRPAEVEVDGKGRPRAAMGVEVDTVREEWLVEDRWWDPAPLHRHYFELVLSDGRNLVVFRSGQDGRWYAQRA